MRSDIEIINIDDTPVKSATHTILSVLPRDESSDDEPTNSLPCSKVPRYRSKSSGDLETGLSSFSKRVRQVRALKPRSARALVDAIEFSPAQISAPHAAAPAKTSDVIDLDSSDNESLQNEKHQHEETHDPRPLCLNKSNTYPTTHFQQSSSTSGMLPLSSNILNNLERLLQNTTNPSDANKSKTKVISAKRTLVYSDSDTEHDSQDVATAPVRKKAMRNESSTTQQLKARKQAEKEEMKRLKAAEKEQKLIEKRRAQSISAVNVLKKSKKDTSEEMIVELCASFSKSALYTHLSSFMEELKCTFYTSTMLVPGLVRFRRQVKAYYDDDEGHWMPLDVPRIEEEDQLMVILNARAYVEIAATKDSLAAHVHSVRAAKPTAKVLYLLEGLTGLLRRSQTAKNRAFQAAVRSGGALPGPQTVSRQVNSSSQAIEYDEEAIQDSLLDLQVLHGCFIVHSSNPQDTAEQLSILVSDLSTVPYKVDRLSKALIYCTEAGQIKTGVDQRDTFEKMLQAITRVTPQSAQAIAARFSGIRELTRSLNAGLQVLANIPKGHNVDGSTTNQVLGMATAQRIYKALTVDDEFAES